MDLLPAAGLAAGAGYLCGSTPFAWIAVRLRAGQDLRTVGSGNVGATNAARVLGRAWFPVLFALDFAKGAVPVLLAGMLTAQDFAKADSLWIRCAAGAAAILGHLFPLWLGFRGGKGVATGAGVVAPLVPDALGVGVLVFLLVLALSRFVSLGSVLGAVAAAAWLFWSRRDSPGDPLLPVGLLLGALVAAVVLGHIPNLRRIAAGTEPRVFAGAPPPPAPGKEPPRAP